MQEGGMGEEEGCWQVSHGDKKVSRRIKKQLKSIYIKGVAW